jgi:hypothetical protein
MVSSPPFFAYESIAALFTDFGFTVQALRDIGAALVSPDILPISGALFVARLLQTAIAFLTVSRFTHLGHCFHGPSWTSCASCAPPPAWRWTAFSRQRRAKST